MRSSSWLPGSPSTEVPGVETLKIPSLFCSAEKVTGALQSQLGGRSSAWLCGFPSGSDSSTFREAFVVPSRMFPDAFF